MAVFECKNCRFRFQATQASKCPRCDSIEVSEYAAGRHRRPEDSAPSGPGPSIAPGTTLQPRVIREGKEGWRDFHNQQASVCPECGGAEFDLNWKRKEKTCKKCGAVLPLPRRFA